MASALLREVADRLERLELSGELRDGMRAAALRVIAQRIDMAFAIHPNGSVRELLDALDASPAATPLGIPKR